MRRPANLTIGPPEDYNTLKGRWTETICLIAKAARLANVFGAGLVSAIWHEPDRKRDPDNVIAGGMKLILDGLVLAGILASDGHKGVTGYGTHLFIFPGEFGYRGPGVGVELSHMRSVTSLFIPHRLPDLNELLAARELGARKSVYRRQRQRVMR